MSLKETLELDVDNIINQQWDIKDGTVVPEFDAIPLAGGARKFKATILYSDLADSTLLAMSVKNYIVGEVYKSFLSCASKIIKDLDGKIRSFDGDRVMGIFIGDRKNSNAAECALKINYAFLHILKPKLENRYPELQNRLAHCTGIDTSPVMVIRSGVKNDNDLVWIGRAPNIAAKLSNINEKNYHTYITKNVFDSLSDSSKYSDGKLMWEPRIWIKGIEGVKEIYRSKWCWKP